MEEVYLSMKEASDLEGIPYATFARKISQMEKEADVVVIKKADGGGKGRKYIKLSDLSPKAQKAYRALHEIESVKGDDVILEKMKSKENPWYLDTDMNWYREHNKASYYRAVELAKVIQELLDYSGDDKTEYIRKRAEQMGMSQRTMYRNMDSYVEASGWALKLLKETGANYDYYKILCLCRKPKTTEEFPSFSPAVKQVIKNIWFDQDFARNKGTREMLYTKLEAVSEQTGWSIPSYASVCRYITYLMQDKKMANAHYLAENGTRAWKNKKMVKALRDTSRLQVMEVVMGDEHTFDCWVSYRTANGKVIAIRPKLVAWIDVRSRMVFGDIICRDANSQILKESILKMMYSDPGGLPKYLNIDNGKDYTGKAMTGVDRNERYPGFEDIVNGFYAAVGIQDYHRAKPYEPWTKSEIERLFTTVCNGFTRWFKSYTGTLTGSKTSAKVDKDIKRMLEQGKLLTMEEFYEKWSYYLHEVYAKHIHRGLKAMKEDHTTPLDLYENAERYEKALPPKSFAVIELMKADTARVYNVGIRKFGNVYNHEELVYYLDKQVDIKYDPEDVTRLYVFDRADGHRICEAVSQELLQIAHRVPQASLEEHLKAQKRQLKKDREMLEDARKPLDERIAGAAEANTIVGNMMIEGRGNAGKVVELPVEKSYREIQKDKKTESSYIAGKGAEVLEMIRNLG